MVDARSVPSWLIGLALVSCGSRTIGDDSPHGGDLTTGSSAGSAGSSGGTAAGGTGAHGGSAGTGGSGGSGITGGAGGFGATGGSGGSGITGGAGGFGATGGSGGSGAAGGSGGSGGGGGNVCTTPLDCPCTRRPGMGNCFICPMGAGQSTSGVVDARTGGIIGLYAQQGAGVPFNLTIPPRALATDVRVTVTETTIPPPIDYVDYSPVYVVESPIPTSLPMQLLMPYSNKSSDVANLSIYFASDPSGPFSRLAGSAVSAGFIEGSVSQFGALFVGYPRTPAQQSCP
jgi:hypothetical protein